MRSACSRFLTGFILLLLGVLPARSEGPADPLLELVPPDAGATLAVEDLSVHVDEVLKSPFVKGLGQLPAVRAWREGPQFQQFQQARGDIEKALGIKVGSLRDGLLGKAFVLSLHLAPEAGPDEARGLLLTQLGDRELLNRLIGALNANERAEGTLTRVSERTHAGQSYFVREFRPGTKPSEAYVTLPGGIFAWSNSEALVQEVINRQKAPGGGLASMPKFRAVRDALPSQALASLYVDPRLLERVSSSSAPSNMPSEEQTRQMMLRYLAAVEYAGLALEWRDGLVLHLHESIDPTKLDEPLRRWASRPAGPEGTSALIGRVPKTAMALAAGHVDFTSVADILTGLVPEDEQPRAETFFVMLSGLLLGKDVRSEILPSLGPEVVAYVDEPDSATNRPPLVLALAIGRDETGDRPTVSAALDNALRTLLALSALDKSAGPPRRVETRTIEGVRVTSLDGGSSPFVYAVGPGFVVLGSTAKAVAMFAAGSGELDQTTRFARTRAEYFPHAGTFAYADAVALSHFVETHRERLAGRLASKRESDVADARRDLDQALGLLRLLRAAFATSTLAPDFSSAHRTLGLLAQDEPATEIKQER